MMAEAPRPYAAGMTWWLGHYWTCGERVVVEVPAFTRADAEAVLRETCGWHSGIDRRVEEAPR